MTATLTKRENALRFGKRLPSRDRCVGGPVIG